MYIRGRLLLVLPTAFGVTLVTFFMIHLNSGGPRGDHAGNAGDPKAVALLPQ